MGVGGCDDNERGDRFLEDGGCGTLKVAGCRAPRDSHSIVRMTAA